MAKKVLIIDDDVDFRETSKIVLESKGYAVVEANSGVSGLEKIQCEKPDFILLHLDIQDSYSLATCQRIKMHRTSCSIRWHLPAGSDCS